MAFTRSGVRSPSPPLDGRQGRHGGGGGTKNPTERLDWPTAHGNSSVGRAHPCQGWGRGFESRFPLWHSDAGWSSLVARRAHNPEVVGSNPTPATRMRNAECGMRNGPMIIPHSEFHVPHFARGG